MSMTVEWWRRCGVSKQSVLLGHKENEIMLFAATWVDLVIIMLSEMSHRDKYVIVCSGVSIFRCSYRVLGILMIWPSSTFMVPSVRTCVRLSSSSILRPLDISDWHKWLHFIFNFTKGSRFCLALLVLSTPTWWEMAKTPGKHGAQPPNVSLHLGGWNEGLWASPHKRQHVWTMHSGHSARYFTPS